MSDPSAAEALSTEEEAEVRRADARFNPTDIVRADWLVDLLFERRRLLATLDRDRAAALPTNGVRTYTNGFLEAYAAALRSTPEADR